MVKAELQRVLEEAGVAYEFLRHEHTETAAAEAQALGIPAAEVAKTLLLETPEGHLRVVVPASERLDLRKVRIVLGVSGKQVQLANEERLERDYPGFELGAVPPFGGPADPVLMDARLLERQSVAIEAGTHEESVRLAPDDLRRLTHATIADICED